MRSVRLLILLLATTIAAGPILLDRCLISCHDDSSSTAVPACHEHASPSSALSVHAVDACGHDHDGSSPADTVTDASGNAVRHADLAAGTSTLSHPEPPRSMGTALNRRIAHRSASASHVLTQLRV